MTETRVLHRYWRRTNKPVTWWPWGVLPLAAIFLVWLLGGAIVAPAMERQVREDVTARLAEFPVSQIIADGQDINVRLAAADGAQQSLVESIARATQCETWTGLQVCPARVRVAVTQPKDEAVAVDESPAVALQPSPVTLARDRCNERFAEVLSASTIQFETGSARIGRSSEAALLELARVGAACAGRLVVEGHTDAVGNRDNNLALSQARANAVRDALIARGLAAERIDAFGFGESRPIADNVSEAGRSKNRRIVIRVAND